jgi:pilus assembly protein CpaE
VHGKLTSLCRREEGGIAVEFALLVPLLALGLIFTGFMAERLQRWINQEQILRAGAEAAVRDEGMNAVLARMKAAAVAKGYAVWHGGAPIPLDHIWFNVARNCACAETLGLTSPDCRTPCPTGRPQIVRYSLASNFRTSFNYDFMLTLARLRLYTPGGESIQTKMVLVR